MSLFEDKEKEEKPLQKSYKNNKAKVANLIKDKKGNILHLIVDVNGNGQRIKYNEKIHGQINIGDEIVI